MSYTVNDLEQAFRGFNATVVRKAKGKPNEYLKIYGPAMAAKKAKPYVTVLTNSGGVCFSKPIAGLLNSIDRNSDSSLRGIPKPGRFKTGLTPAEIFRRFPASPDDFVLAVLGAFSFSGIAW